MMPFHNITGINNTELVKIFNSKIDQDTQKLWPKTKCHISYGPQYISPTGYNRSTKKFTPKLVGWLLNVPFNTLQVISGTIKLIGRRDQA